MFLENLIKDVSGSASLTINMKGKEAAVISVVGKEITADIKDPFAFMDFGFFHEFMKKKNDSNTIKKLKESGFKVSLKYKGFKIDL